MWYSVQPRDQIFVKDYGVLSFAKNMNKNIGKNISKNLIDKYSQKLLNHTEQLATYVFKTASKRAIQKNSRSNWWFDWLIEIKKSQKVHCRIIQKQMQMNMIMIKKYLKKDLHFQKKDKKLFMI